MKSRAIKILLLSALLIFSTFSCLPKDKVKGYVFGFYNVENLFDTVDDPETNDNDFLPEGKYGWTPERYSIKLKNIARVIRKMKEQNGVYHTVLGLAEVENAAVLADLTADPDIADAGYVPVHYDSPDPRGIDVALLYRPDQFKFIESENIPYTFEGTSVSLDLDPNARTHYRTRSILMVHGTIKGEHFAIYVAHLPSRTAGKASPLRCVGAEIIYRHALEMEKKHPGIKTVVMGDMNDNPGDESQTVWLHGKGSLDEVSPTDFFNPFLPMHEAGLGSEEYKGAWNIFDIIQVNYNLAKAPSGGRRIRKAGESGFYGAIFNPSFLTQQSGKYAGTPFRTFSHGEFIAGFSDHYPTYIIIQ